MTPTAWASTTSQPSQPTARIKDVIAAREISSLPVIAAATWITAASVTIRFSFNATAFSEYFDVLCLIGGANEVLVGMFTSTGSRKAHCILALALSTISEVASPFHHNLAA